MNTVSPEEVGVSSARLERVNKLMQDYVGSNKLAGISTRLARRGAVYHSENFGVADIESGRPVDDDTIWRIYSMTKPITSVAIMMLYEEGAFQLDDPVSDFIPELDGLKVYAGMGQDGLKLVDQERPITIRSLLNHTSGLSYGFYQDTPIDAMYRSQNLPGGSGNLKDMIGKLSQLPLASQPGTNWRYSVATDVLGYLVEVLSGQPFDQYLQQKILGPLGMIDTAFYVTEDKLDRLATVYGPSDENGITALDTPQVNRHKAPVTLFSGGGGLVSTASDYLRFSQMLLNNGELEGVSLLSRKTIEMMASNHLSDDLLPFSVSPDLLDYSEGAGFGLGFKVVMDVARTGVLGSEGNYSWGGAACTTFWIDPKEELIAVFMTSFMPSSTYPVQRQFQIAVYQSLVD